MNELKIHVERAVRPVVATKKTKLRMRNELYAHLLDVYQEETLRSDDESAALEAAEKRFGAAGELTLELQQTVSCLDWCEGRLDSWLWRRAHETELRQVCRFAGFYLLLSVAMFLPLCFGAWWLQVTVGNSDKSLLDASLDVVRYGISMFVFFALQAFAFVPIGARIYRQFEGSLWPKSPLVVMSLSICLAAFVLATGWALHLVMLGSTEGILALLHPRWTIVSALSPIAVILFTIAVQREFAASAPWTSLQIDE